LANDNKIIGDVRKTFENVRLRDFLHSSLRNILNFHLENVWPTVGVCANDVNLLQPICLSDLNITSLNPLYRARQTMRDELIQTDSEQLPMVNVSVSNNNNNNNNGLPIDPNRNRLMLSLMFDDDRVYYPNDGKPNELARGVFYALFKRVNAEPLQLVSPDRTQEYYDRSMRLRYQMGHFLYELERNNSSNTKDVIDLIVNQTEMDMDEREWRFICDLLLNYQSTSAYEANLIPKLCDFFDLNENVLMEQLPMTVNVVNTDLMPRYVLDCSRLDRNVIMSILQQYPRLGQVLSKGSTAMLNELFVNQCFFNIVQLLQIFKFIPTSRLHEQIEGNGNGNTFQLTANVAIANARKLNAVIDQQSTADDNVVCSFRKPSGNVSKLNFRCLTTRCSSTRDLSALKRLKQQIRFVPKKYELFRNYLKGVDGEAIQENLLDWVEYVAEGRDLISLCIVSELYARFYSRALADCELGSAKIMYNILSDLTVSDLQRLDAVFGNTELPYDQPLNMKWKRLELIWDLNIKLPNVITSGFAESFSKALDVLQSSERSIPQIADTMAATNPITGRKRILNQSEQYRLQKRRDKRVKLLQRLDIQQALPVSVHELTVIKYWQDNYERWLTAANSDDILLVLHVALLQSNTSKYNRAFLQHNLDIPIVNCELDVYQDLRFASNNEPTKCELHPRLFRVGFDDLSDEELMQLYVEMAPHCLDKHLPMFVEFKCMQDFVIGYLNEQAQQQDEFQ
jgi:hypothetical protein